MSRFAFSYVLLVLTLLGIFGCASQPDVVLFGAASTADAIDAIKQQFERETGIAVRTSYAASSTLALQIADGAPADVFVSANQEWADHLQQEDLIVSRRCLLENRLVIITPADSALPIHGAEDLLREDVQRLALADTESVPAGMYAKEALTNLGLWEGVREKVVPGMNVRQALVNVQRREADAGIVYASDAAIARNIKVAAEIPAETTGSICYPIVLLKRAEENPRAKAFHDYLRSAESAKVFQRYGFLPPSRQTLETAGEAAPFAESRPLEPQRPLSRSWLTATERTALRLSFLVAACAALAGLPPAVAIGYWLARVPFTGKWAVEALVNLPLVLPPVVTGYLLLVCFGRHGPVGRLLADWFGVTVVFSWLGAVLASGVVGFPLMVRAIRLAFQAVDPRLEAAARSLGASRLEAFLTVAFPLARRGVVAGWLLAFARSLGEFGATIMVAGNIVGQTQTIPLAIFTMAHQPDGIQRSWRLVGLSVLLACGALAVSELLERRQSRHESA
jgi:molybdate transport system permease protein